MTGEQIARMAGCSVSTVSRVLNNTGPVSAHARKAILDAVAASGAVPRVRGPRRSSAVRVAEARPRGTGLIDLILIRGRYYSQPANPSADGLAVPQPAHLDTYYRHLSDAVIEQAQRIGYRVVVQRSPNLHDRLITSEKSSDGLVMMGEYREGVEDFIARWTRPVVSFVAPKTEGLCDYVGIDNMTGIAAAFDHVRALGHTRIGYVAGAQDSRALRERYATYRLKCADAGLPIRPEWVFCGQCSFSEDRQAAEAMLRLPDRPTAILCCYDGAALAVRRAAETVGLRIPHDLSVVGFDDLELAGMFEPPLTSVHVPTTLMASQAVQMLKHRMEHRKDDQLAPAGLRVMPRLVVRQSTAAPAATV